MVNVVVNTPSYNEKRYGRPWCARVRDTQRLKDFEFFSWIGRNGSTGEFRETLEVGTVLAYGQKDYRKNRGGVDLYGIVTSAAHHEGTKDEHVRWTTRIETIRAWIQEHAMQPDNATNRVDYSEVR